MGSRVAKGGAGEDRRGRVSASGPPESLLRLRPLKVAAQAAAGAPGGRGPTKAPGDVSGPTGGPVWCSAGPSCENREEAEEAASLWTILHPMIATRLTLIVLLIAASAAGACRGATTRGPLASAPGEGRPARSEAAASAPTGPPQGAATPSDSDLDPPPLLTALERSQFEHATRYSENFGGLSVLVMRDGQVIFEQYREGVAPTTPHALASGTKSFAGAIAIAAVEDGLLSLDELVADTITEWQQDRRRSRITLRQLLTLTSGIPGGTIGRPPSYADAIKTAAKAEPGAKFQYGPAPFQIFGEVMRRKLVAKAATSAEAESVEAYLTRRVLDPIGLEVGAWRKDRDGNINLPSGALLAAREWAKFGELIRNGGAWNGVQVLRADLVAELLVPSSANPRYGLTFWLNTADGRGLDPEELLARTADLVAGDEGDEATQSNDSAPGAESDLRTLFMAAGLGKQRCYVIPSRNLVIVRQGPLDRRSAFKDDAFLRRMLGE